MSVDFVDNGSQFDDAIDQRSDQFFAKQFEQCLESSRYYHTVCPPDWTTNRVPGHVTGHQQFTGRRVSGHSSEANAVGVGHRGLMSCRPTISRTGIGDIEW